MTEVDKGKKGRVSVQFEGNNELERERPTDPVRLADGHPEIFRHLGESYHYSSLRALVYVSVTKQPKKGEKIDLRLRRYR